MASPPARNTATRSASRPRTSGGVRASFGAQMAAIMREVATDVTEAVIPESGHWLMEEQPDATVQVIRDFLARPAPAS